ncbi:helix-turn-helix domain-containing protein [Mucilaginibacter dorajii]|uniref:HTH cro/C1-type domain-containing protein n=1 Tax=Mucilaginibacter dorajii TaxID=692994 RepID=A0ABP7PMD5_9SPHI|nr:helix-turn-helix transcriptional regulator [Mucilaginibacter dorajii]MCS3733729.1 transcriptional regulator with XRE-family HTH domain [Mucilaginibacter dorajii]
MKALGQNIRTLRHQKGWSQEDVARQLDISVPAFSKIETGITDINLSRMEQIAGIFGISAVQLLTLNEDNQEKFTTELDAVNKQLLVREAEVIGLQKKVIALFEELRGTRIPA